MKVRPAASMLPLDEAMEQVVDIPDKDSLLAFLKEQYAFWSPTEENVTVQPYGRDERIGWDTHLICVAGKAALFSDGWFPNAVGGDE